MSFSKSSSYRLSITSLFQFHLIALLGRFLSKAGQKRPKMMVTQEVPTCPSLSIIFHMDVLCLDVSIIDGLYDYIYHYLYVMFFGYRQLFLTRPPKKPRLKNLLLPLASWHILAPGKVCLVFLTFIAHPHFILAIRPYPGHSLLC